MPTGKKLKRRRRCSRKSVKLVVARDVGANTNLEIWIGARIEGHLEYGKVAIRIGKLVEGQFQIWTTLKCAPPISGPVGEDRA
jgi:hypothetical protein